MASAYKCDRCDGYFDSISADDGTVVTASIYRKGMFFNSEDYDLCPSCQEKLEKFLKGVDYDVVPVMSTEE